ncbi:MAG: hypothetical protein IJ415_01865 [Clostridia bacterium]|nr:hypothetical protein [Clostridia bacterium]
MKIKIINKSIIFIMLLFIVTLTFSACAQVRVMTITNDDDTIDELVTVTIVPEEVFNAGYNLSELKLDIETNSIAEAQKMADKLNQKIFADLLLVRDEESVNTLNGFKDGISVIKSDWNNNTYAIGIRFKNIDVYKYYYGITESTSVEMQTEEHFFYDKVYYYASTMYVKHHDLYTLVNNYYSTQYPELIESERNELLYTYKTDLRRQHSDADYITKQDGEYYHTWVVDKNNLDEPIMLYYNIANPENYVLVALGVTAAVSIILLAVGFIINKVKKKKANPQSIEIKKDDEN